MTILRGSHAHGRAGSGGGIIVHCPVSLWMGPTCRRHIGLEGGSNGMEQRMSFGRLMGKRSLVHQRRCSDTAAAAIALYGHMNNTVYVPRPPFH